MRIDPDHTTGLPGGGTEARERAERDRVVATQDEWERAVGDDLAGTPMRREQAARISGRKRACSFATTTASGSGSFPRSTTAQPNDGSAPRSA